MDSKYYLTVFGVSVIAVCILFPMSVRVLVEHSRINSWSTGFAKLQDKNATKIIPHYGSAWSSAEIYTLAEVDGEIYPIDIVYPPLEVLNRKSRKDVRLWLAAHSDLPDLPVHVDLKGGMKKVDGTRYLAYSENINIGSWVFWLIACCLVILFWFTLLFYSIL